MGAGGRGLFLVGGAVLPVLGPLTADKAANQKTAHPWETHAEWAGGAGFACGVANE